MEQMTKRDYNITDYAVIMDVVKHKHDLDMAKFNLLMSFYRLCHREYKQLESNQKDQIAS
jgi:hypothetical protein